MFNEWNLIQAVSKLGVFFLGHPLEEKAHAGNATQNIHPPLIQKTRIRIQPHTLHHSYKSEDRSTALARSVVVTYYWGLQPVYVRTTSLLSPISILSDIQCTYIINPIPQSYNKFNR